MKFTCIDNGNIYETKKDERYLWICPICEQMMHSNRYKDLYVARDENDDDISIEIAMEYCCECELLFIREDY